MRLICPNCAAQYEVDVSMIPPEGRDVQCSSCGHAWFQPRQSSEENIADAEGVSEPAPPRQDPPRPAPEPAIGDDIDDDPDEDETDVPAAGPVMDVTPPQPRPLDASARAVLREEALREAEARRRDAPGPMETQTDLGLEDGGRRTRRSAPAEPATQPAASVTDDAPADHADDAPADHTDAAIAAALSGSRGELLPDIEEINSTLTATSDRHSTAESDDGGDDPDTSGRSAFRIGFLGVLCVLAVLALLYVFGPSLAQAVPALAPAVGAYLDMANGVLDGLQAGMGSVVDQLNGLLGTQSAG
ncbi:zinc-ribbon domain-containing protein [Oceaniglobus indicus]|uniref:zinc-ribbon domain-containing protein n=1 Tax=Oceaniglobus indicus TaxID=2047749 RepID=UPI0013041066|nr:zinc-ribbon domain-containing protein [Oceaniglobus indicus]